MKVLTLVDVFDKPRFDNLIFAENISIERISERLNEELNSWLKAGIDSTEFINEVHTSVAHVLDDNTVVISGDEDYHELYIIRTPLICS